MRIGIDVDDTICKTTEIVKEKMKEFAKEKGFDVLEVMNNELIRESFFKEYLPIIYENVEIKQNASAVIRRLRHKGNEIFIITGRKKSQVQDVMNVTEKWLNRQNIEVDGIFSSAYGETKADVCKREKIDLMVDDDPYNYKMITSNGGHCLLFDDKEKYDLKQDYVTNWLEVEEYINKFRA